MLIYYQPYQNAMLPPILLEEVLQYLDSRTLSRLRLVSREFNHFAVPIIFRVHTLKKINSRGFYQAFLQKYGKFFKGLAIPNITALTRLRGSLLEISEIFPRLRSVTIRFLKSHGPEDYSQVVSDLLKLPRLRHVDFFGTFEEDLFFSVAPVARRLQSLAFDTSASNIRWGIQPVSYNGLTLLKIIDLTDDDRDATLRLLPGSFLDVDLSLYHEEDWPLFLQNITGNCRGSASFTSHTFHVRCLSYLVPSRMLKCL